MSLTEDEIVVIIPAYNEAGGIGLTLKEVMNELESSKIDPEYIVVNRPGSDNTAAIAALHSARLLTQEGRGKGRALAQAFASMTENAKYVVITDADYTYPARYIPRMLRILEADPSVGMVCGNRFDRRIDLKSAMKHVYYLGNRLLSLAQYLLNGVKMRDPLTGLRIIKTELVKDWVPKSRGFDIEAELNYYVHKLGFEIREIPIEYRRRLGKKKLTAKHGFVILNRIILQALNL